MKSELFTVITLCMAVNSAQGGQYRYPTNPTNNIPANNIPNNRYPAGLDYAGSVQQAKQQLRYFFAGTKPIKASLDTLENHYEDVVERGMDRDLEPMKRVRRPPCKVLPDPQPGLVNPLLIAPVHRYRPIRRNERFYGKFAPPISYEFPKDENQMVVGSIPPIKGQYGDAAPGGVPFPVIQKQTVYATNNPFYGYQSGDGSESDYFQKPAPTRTRRYHSDPTAQPTVTPTLTSWQANLNTDYSLRMSSMSAALALNSAAMASMSWSVYAASLSSQWAVKEASLQAKLASYSATATSTRKGWHW